MKLIASNEPIGRASKMDLYTLKTLHLLSFKTTQWIPKELVKTEQALQGAKSRVIY
ncbi:hypothetical protein [Virgibacillus sp. CBA3643]|uniref:hypothetical protein n=1 Tax=Virgibacillus sp. CBA3643 TaxID=2942278 RepID=UPI0035A33469